MSNVMYCKYCGSKMTNLSGICTPCTEKLMLIRKIRAIVFAIKRDADREREIRNEKENKGENNTVRENERMMEIEQTGDNPHIETVQRIAS